MRQYPLAFFSLQGILKERFGHLVIAENVVLTAKKTMRINVAFFVLLCLCLISCGKNEAGSLENFLKQQGFLSIGDKISEVNGTNNFRENTIIYLFETTREYRDILESQNLSPIQEDSREGNWVVKKFQDFGLESNLKSIMLKSLSSPFLIDMYFVVRQDNKYFLIIRYL